MSMNKNSQEHKENNRIKELLKQGQENNKLKLADPSSPVYNDEKTIESNKND